MGSSENNDADVIKQLKIIKPSTKQPFIIKLKGDTFKSKPMTETLNKNEAITLSDIPMSNI